MKTHPQSLRRPTATGAGPRNASLIGGATLLGLIAVMGGGCSGINASQSVSPLDFLLPGLMQNEPAAPAIPEFTNTPPELAQARRDSLLRDRRTTGRNSDVRVVAGDECHHNLLS